MLNNILLSLAFAASLATAQRSVASLDYGWPHAAAATIASSHSPLGSCSVCDAKVHALAGRAQRPMAEAGAARK